MRWPEIALWLAIGLGLLALLIVRPVEAHDWYEFGCCQERIECKDGSDV